MKEPRQPPASKSMPDVIDGMGEYCKNQLELCDALETIADSLPDNVDTQKCLHTARALYPTIKAAHEFEEAHLFPALDVLEIVDSRIDASVERLRYEHWEDE
ncbi:MAG: hemerythrin domain-containing protein, partial [Hyphomicrobiales bacterium]|nr:hemerythrin domain-containing protein [Hyphomicrobiales bacterium]